MSVPAFIQSIPGNSSGTNTVTATFGSNNDTGGDGDHAIVVIVRWGSNSTAGKTGSNYSVTDSAGNTYTSAAGPFDDGVAGGAGDTLFAFVAHGIRSNVANTVTVTVSNDSNHRLIIECLEYSHIATSPLDATNGSSVTGSNPSPITCAAITTTVTNDVVIAVYESASNVASPAGGTFGGAWTDRDNGGGTNKDGVGSLGRLWVADQVAVGVSTYTPSFSWTGTPSTTSAATITLSLKAATAVVMPLFPTAIENPRGALYPSDLRTSLDPMRAKLIGKDTFFGAQGQGPSYDYPNPIPRGYQLDLRTFINPGGQNYAAANLLSLGSPTFDWPNPVWRTYPQDLRTSLWNGLESTLRSPSPFTPMQWDLPTPKPYDTNLRTFIGYFIVDNTAPFSTVEWPLPVLPRWDNDLRTLAQPRYSLLSGVTGPQPFYTHQSWDPPQGRTYPSDLRVWLQQSISTGNVLPFSQTEWPNPVWKKTPLDVVSFLQSTFIPFATTPFALLDWPNPTPRSYDASLRTGTNPALTFYNNIVAPFQVLDWALPQTTPYPISLRTFLGYYVNDFSVPFLPVEWPNPTARSYPQDLRTSVQQALALSVILPNPFFQTTWLNPFPAPYSESLRTWVQAALTSRGVAGTQPFNQTNWPLPVTRVTPLDVTSFIQKSFAQFITTPFTAFDWPNPVAKRYDHSLREWLNPSLSLTNTTVVPFQNVDWSLPRLATYPRNLHTLASYYVLGTIAPFIPIEWNNPSQKPYPFDLRTGVQQALALSVFLPNPFFQLDWNNPTPGPYSPSLRTWTQAALTSIGIMGTVPFHQTEWPNPLTKLYALDLRTSIYYSQISGVPFNQIEWTNPPRRTYPQDLRTHVQPAKTLPTSSVVPFHMLEWPNPPTTVYALFLRGDYSTAFNPNETIVSPFIIATSCDIFTVNNDRIDLVPDVDLDLIVSKCEC